MPPVDWNLVLQSGAGSFFGALVVYLAGLILLSFDSKIESNYTVENRRKKWFVKSVGSKPAYILKIEGDPKFTPRYLPVTESLDLPSGTLGGRIYYKRFKGLPLFKRYIVYGSSPDFLAERGIVRKLRKRGVTGYLIEICRVNSPRTFIAIQLFLALRMSSKTSLFRMTLSLSVNPKDQEQLSFSLIELAEFEEPVERIVSRYVLMPYMFSSRLIKRIASGKPKRKKSEYSFDVSRKALVIAIFYLLSPRGRRDSSSSNSILTPRDFMDSIFYDPRGLVDYVDLTNPTEEDSFASPLVEQETTSLKQIRVHESLEISSPARLDLDPNIGLIFSQDSWNINASEKHRKFVLIRNDGVIVYQDQNLKRGAKLVADIPKSIKLTREEATLLRSKVENWKKK